MDLEDVCRGLDAVNNKLDTVHEKVNQNTSNISKLTAQRGLAEMLIRWVIFPLVSILGAAYGVENILTRMGGG